jgi:hypothetical protein
MEFSIGVKPYLAYHWEESMVIFKICWYQMQIYLEMLIVSICVSKVSILSIEVMTFAMPCLYLSPLFFSFPILVDSFLL